MPEDNELLFLAAEKDEDAMDLLLKRYYAFICYKVSKGTLFEQDRDDFINEGIMCFYEAVYSYDESDGTKFCTYLNTCLDRRFSNYRKFLSRKKFYALNNAISLDDSSLSLDNILFDKKNDPDFILLNDEKYNILKNRIVRVLNSDEELVFILKEQDFSVNEISRIIDKRAVDIYNIIKSIRAKVVKII